MEKGIAIVAAEHNAGQESHPAYHVSKGGVHSEGCFESPLSRVTPTRCVTFGSVVSGKIFSKKSRRLRVGFLF